MVESKSVPYLLDLGPSMSSVVSPGRMTHSRLIGAGLIDNRRCFLNLLDNFSGTGRVRYAANKILHKVGKALTGIGLNSKMVAE